MIAVSTYADRALRSRCIICCRRITNFAIWVGSAAVTEWTRDSGEIQSVADLLVCSDECFGLYEAGEKVPA